MKICFDNEIFWNQKVGGISSRYYYNLIKILDHVHKQDVRVFAKYYQNKKIDDLPKNIIKGKRLKFKPPFTGKIFQKLNSFFLNGQIEKFKPDIIHKTFYSNIFKKNPQSKIVLTVFDLWHEKDSSVKIRPKANSINMSDHIICPSVSTKNDLLEIYNVNEEKVTVTYFGAEKFENINIKKNVNNNEKQFLLFVGSRGRYKNFNNLIKAFAQSERLYKDFNIKCFGGEEFSKEEINLFNQLQITDCVHREKHTDDETLLDLYKRAKCLVYPSEHEGLGLPPIEAMSFGCPTITSNHPAILEGVGDASANFDPKDIFQIKKILEEYLYSQDKMKKLIELGLLRSKKFSWEKCVEETLNIYKMILN